MASAADLAAKVSELERRLAAVERTAQLPRTAIDGGQLLVTDGKGTVLLALGDQGDGVFGLAGLNGGTVIANDLNLPAGTITETDISDEAVTTPKLVANAVTADKIDAGAVTAEKLTADAIDGRVIRGVTIVAGEFLAVDEDGSYVHIFDEPGDGDGAVIEMGLPANAGEQSRPARLRTGRSPVRDRAALLIEGPRVTGGRQAQMFLYDGVNGYGGYFESYADIWACRTANTVSWMVESGRFEIGFPTGEGSFSSAFSVEAADRITTIERVVVDTGIHAEWVEAPEMFVFGQPVMFNTKAINTAVGATAGLTSATYVPMAGSTSMSFTKWYGAAETKLQVRLVAGARNSVANNVAGVGRFGVRIGSTDYDVTGQVFTVTNDHLPVAGERDILGVGAGTFTVQAVWRRVSGSALTQDTNDWLSLSVSEIPVGPNDASTAGTAPVESAVDDGPGR